MDKGYFKSIYLIGLLLIVVLQALDVVSTFFNVNGTGLFVESNPFMIPFTSNILVLLVTKVLSIAVVTVIGEYFRRRNMILTSVAIVWFIAGFSMGIVWSNVLQIIAVIRFFNL